MTAARIAWLGLLGGLLVASACERAPVAGEDHEVATVELDAGELRANAIAGLAAAAADPVIASELGLVAALEQPLVEAAVERLLARVGADPRVTSASEQLFVDIQSSPAMRTSLAEFARANPELDLTELTEGFVAHVDARLTRPAIAEAIEASLRSELHAAELPLAHAWVVEAKAAELLATAMIVSFANGDHRAQLESRLGKDPAALQDRLAKRLAEPHRVGTLIGQLGEPWRAESGLAGLVVIVDHEQTAQLLAGALARALADADVQDHCKLLFELALAEELDAREFERELGRLLDQAVVVREAAALVAALAREEYVREQVANSVAVVVRAPGFGSDLIAALR